MAAVVAPQVDPRAFIDFVKDPIHGYIMLTRSPDGSASELDLVSNRWLQRLRRVRQLQGAWYVYPAADHSRFLHSLGVMQMAGEFAHWVYARYLANRPPELFGPKPELNHVIETFRLAGLLHDIGHGPFAHLFDEKCLQPTHLSHEKMSEKIIRSELGDIIIKIRRSPYGAFNDPISIDILAGLLVSEGETHLKGVWRALYQIIRGAYDADKIDFVLRDSLLTGQGGVLRPDLLRLWQTSVLSKEDPVVLCLHVSSLAILRRLLAQRQDLFEIVYFHRAVRAFELSIGEALGPLVDSMWPNREDLESYFHIDDVSLVSQARTACTLEATAFLQAADARQFAWREVYSDFGFGVVQENAFLRGISTPKQIQERIQETILEMTGLTCLVDTPTVNTPHNIYAESQDALHIFDPQRGAEEVSSVGHFLSLPQKKTLFRVYLPRASYKPEDAEKIRTAFAELGSTSTLQGTSY